MILKIKTSADVPSSEVTPEHVYRSRREFMQAAAAGAVGVGGRRRLIGGGAGGLDAAQQALPAKKSAVHRRPSRSAEHLRADHELQQLLRVRHRQGRSGAERRPARPSSRGP